MYPLVPLGEVLKKSEDWINIYPDCQYRQVTIKMWGQGVVQRNEVAGAEIAASRRLRVRGGQFILSRIDARNGALGIVPPELDGAVVSNDFPAFDVATDRILPGYLGWMSRTHDFVELCKAASEGTTNRVRLQEDRFLALAIPLPPLAEQRRVVARIEEIAAKIAEARRLRAEAVEEVNPILAATEMNIWPDTSFIGAPTLEDVTVYLSRGRQSEQGDSEHYLIKTQHVQMGHYVKTNLKLAPHVASKVSRDALAIPGDILIACSAAGCLGRTAFYTDPERITSTDTHVAIARPNKEIVLPEYLYAYLKGAQGQIQLRSRERGDWQRKKIGFRLTELNVADMRRIPVPTPSFDEQRRIVAELDALQAKVDALKALQAETSAELDALLPAVLDRAFRGEL